MPTFKKLVFLALAAGAATALVILGFVEGIASAHDPSTFRRVCYVVGFPIVALLNLAPTTSGDVLWYASALIGFVLWTLIFYTAMASSFGTVRRA